MYKTIVILTDLKKQNTIHFVIIRVSRTAFRVLL